MTSTVIGNIKRNSLRELEDLAFGYRDKLIQSHNIPFEICRRCLGIRVNVLAMGQSKSSEKGEVFFEKIAVFGDDANAVEELGRLRKIGIAQLSFLVNEKGDVLDDGIPRYSLRELPDEVEAIILPSGCIVDDVFVRQLTFIYPDKFIGQINLVALSPFAREKITAHRQKKAVANGMAKARLVSARTSSYWNACVRFIKKFCYTK